MPPEATSGDDPRGTESWALLEHLNATYPGIAVLGGWAAWLHTSGDFSHDVDIVVPLDQFGAMREREHLTPSEHLGGRKFRLNFGPVTHADIYVPYQSQLGQRLKLPVQILLEHTTPLRGFTVLTKEALFVTKIAAILDRPDTLPGRKDREDLIRLLIHYRGSWNWDVVADILGNDRLALAEEAISLIDAPGMERAARRDLRSTLAEASALFNARLNPTADSTDERRSHESTSRRSRTTGTR
jgi:hypothetical protein